MELYRKIKFKPLLQFITVLSVCLMQVLSNIVLAEVSLIKVHKSDTNTSFGEIVSMVELADGVIAAADRDNGQIVRFTDQGVTYQLIAQGKVFDSNKLGGLSLAGEDMLAVSNRSDNNFALITLDAELLTRMGQSGSDAGEIYEPNGIAYSNNRRIYIADTDNNRISVYGADGVYLSSIGKKGLQKKQRLKQPLQVFVDNQERLFVLEGASQGQLVIFNAQGQLVKRLHQKKLKKLLGSGVQITAITIDNAGFVYLADSKNGRIYQIDWRKEEKINAFGSKGEERGQFAKISALLSMKNGHLVVADSGNKKIEIYSLHSVSGKVEEQLNLPTVTRYLPIKMKCHKAYRMPGGDALCLNREKNNASIYSAKSKYLKIFAEIDKPGAAAIGKKNVVILDDERIKVFDLQGNKKYQGKGYAGEGYADGKLSSPESVYIRHKKIYIADTGNKRILIYSADGIYLDKIENPRNDKKQIFEKPVSVVVDSQGSIFVADKGRGQLHVFSALREYMYSLGRGSGNKKQFSEIYDLAIDADNNLYVLCGTEHNRYTIKVFNGPKEVISFSSESDADIGMGEPRNLTVGNSKRALVGVYDKNKNRLLNFSYFQIPALVGGLSVVGSTRQTQLSWSLVPGEFIKGYNVYGSDTETGTYEFVTQVYNNKAVIEHKGDSEKSFYKVNAFTGLGSQGNFSRVREDVFIKGYKYFQKKKFAKAVEVLKPSLNEGVEQPETLKYIGLSLFELGDYDAALQAFREMSNIKEYESEGLNLQVKALVAAKDYISAKAVIESLIEKKIAVEDSYVFCGELSLKLGDSIGAITCLEEALNRNDKNIEAHFLMGDAYVKLGIVDKGLLEFEKAAKIEPGNADVWFRSGLILRELKQTEKAIENFKKTLEINSDHTRAKLELAKIWLVKKNYSQVKTIAISLAGQIQTAAEGQYLLGLVAQAEDKKGEALLALMKATRADEHHVNAWLSLAEVHQAMKQVEKVHPSLEAAVKADPLSFEAAMRLGQFEYDKQVYEEAVVQYTNAVQLRQDHYDARFMLARVLFEMADYKRAFAQANEAKKLNPDNNQPNVLLSRITNKQGKTGKAIDYMKQAMQKQPDSLELTVELGALYSENNLYEQAQKMFEKAALLDASSYLPHIMLGQVYLKRRLFDQSIAAFDKAVSLKPSAENKRFLDSAYAGKKKSLEFKSNAPQIVIKDLRLQQVFSAAYKQYATKPVGSVRIQNTSGTDYGNLRLTFSVKGYMDFPSSKDIAKLSANETQEIDLFASFNNQVLEIDEDTGVQVEVALNFVRDGREDSIRLTQPMTIYGKNAIVWKESKMVGSFVTPKDDTLRDFVRQAINENKPEPGPLSDNLVTAMTLFDVYSAHGIRYVVDPNSPYSEIDDDRVDYVQFARETLKLKSGDCDDLSVLMSAGLENLGISTAMLEVPGHLLMMFDSGVPVTEKNRISLQDDLMVNRGGRIWIPLEATMIGTSFAEAWAEGARKYHHYEKEKNLKAISLAAAWKEYLPVTLKPADYLIDVPDKENVKPLVNREQNILLQKSLDRLVQPYEVMAAARPSDISSLMQIAIIYAKYGLYSQANIAFERILQQSPNDSAVHNNRGNIYYAQNDFERAIETYAYAEQLAANDPGVKVNMAMAYYQLGKLNHARAKFSEAETISQSVTEKYAGLSQLLSR